MILSDLLFGDDDQTNGQGEKIQPDNQNPVNSVGPKNEELEAQREYQRDQSNNKNSDDASAHRNVGGNNHETANETAQGPGFTEEGSYELDEQGEGIRMHEQKLGEDQPGASVQRTQDESL
jgi:hypothetical protein